MGALVGKRAVVTGGGRRVGRAIAERLGREGMHVVVHHHGSADGARETAASIVAAGGVATVLQSDLTDRDARRSFAGMALDILGGLDLLVVNSANFDRVPFDEMGAVEWDRAMALNLEAPVWLAHAFRTALRQASGNVVVITDAGARRPHRNYFPYLVSKSALREAVRILAVEFAPDVRVNAVAPGMVLPPPDWDDAAIERERLRTPLGTVGDPSFIADAVVYLAGAPFVTGAELVVDGGRACAS